MMKYFKHMLDGVVANYQPEGSNTFIPPVPGNTDYNNMIAEIEGGYLTNGDSVAAGTSTIEEVDDTPE